jgi:hypothetical protein
MSGYSMMGISVAGARLYVAIAVRRIFEGY